MKYSVIICSFLFVVFFVSTSSWAVSNVKEDQKVIGVESFYNPSINYSEFIARVTDRDSTNKVIKLYSENANVKFLAAGDVLSFHVASKTKRDHCTGFVRDTDENYFVMFVKNLEICWPEELYLRRGMMLKFSSEIMGQRVKEASSQRALLIKRREDFLKQLNEVNRFLWSYDQQRALLASSYEAKIVELEKEKQKAQELLLQKKQDQINLQKELSKNLTLLDRDLKFYRVDNTEMLKDRWQSDKNLGLPVEERPSITIDE